MRSLVIGFFATLCVFAAGNAAAQVADEPLVLSQDGVSVTLGTTDVLTITVDGMIFSEKTEFSHMLPRWAGTYYEYRRDTTLPLTLKQEKLSGDRQIASFEMHAQGKELEGKQTFELGPGRKLKISVDVRSTTSGRTLVEHMIGDINPAWFAGRQYQTTFRNGKTTEFLMPFASPGMNREELCIAKDFEKLTVETPTGPLEIVTSGTPISLLDYRKNPQGTGKPIIWCGVLAHDFNNYASDSYSIEFTFPPTKEEGTNMILSLDKATLTDAEKAIDEQIIPDCVIPTPKNIQWKKGNLPVSRIVTNKDEFSQLIAKQLQKFISDKYQASIDIETSATARKGDIYIAYTKPEDPNEKPQPEYYTISIEDTLYAATETTESLVAAMRTIKQLLRQGKTKGTVELRKAVIRDYPSMPVRGLYFNTGKDAVEEQEVIISKLMGDLKMNTLMYSVIFAEWKSRPELTKPLISITLKDLQKIADICKREHIELIPAIPTYGLKEWNRYDWVKGGMIGEPVHGQWDNPPELEAVEAVVDEAVKMLKPKTFLICHDELLVSKEQVLASINHWHKFLAKRGVRTAIWSDLFLTQQEGPDATNCKSQEDADWMRSQLPSDILIIDWHYAEAKAEAFKSLKVWNDLGFDCVGGTGNTAGNILPFAQAITKQIASEDTNTSEGKSLGLVVTTWPGRNFNIEAMKKFIGAVQSYVLGAEAAWTGGYDNREDVPFNYVTVFESIWNKSVLPENAEKGWTINFDKVQEDTITKNVFVSLVAKKDLSWLSYQTGDDLAKLPVGPQKFDRFFFDLSKKKTAILLPGKLDSTPGQTASVEIPCNNKKADVINFMTAATLAAPTAEVIATTIINFEDNTTATFDWKIGENVYAITDKSASINVPLLWEDGEGKTSKAIHAYCWQNPEPTKAIKSISFSSNKKSSGLLLFAITGVEGSASNK